MNKINLFLIIILLTTTTILADSEMASAPAGDPFYEPIYANKTSKLFFINYGDAEIIAKLLIEKNNGFLTASGIVVPDKRTNSIWVQDDPENLARITQYIKKIDIPVKQILIEARIVNVDDTFVRNLGMEFGGASTGKKKSNSSELNMDLPGQAMIPGNYTFTIAKFKNGMLLDMALSALESEGHAKIISRPQLITLNREPAHIEAGDEIPYQEKTAQGNTSIAFKKAVLGLKVTPEMVAENKILLKIILNQDKVSQMTVQGEPAISTREINTQVIVEDQQTIVLGGIYEESQDQVIERVPFLGSIPVIGRLFTYKHTTKERKELLIFITPKII